MSIEQFTAAMKAQPFRPFVLHTAAGKEYRVDHPELAMRTSGGRSIVVEDGQHAVAILNLLLIKAITYATPSAASQV